MKLTILVLTITMTILNISVARSEQDFNNDLDCNILEHQIKVQRLLSDTYGDDKEIIRHVDSLNIEQIACFSKHLINLQKRKISIRQANKLELELQDAKNRQKESLTQLQLDGDPKFLQKKKEINASAVVAKNKYPFKIPTPRIDTLSFDPQKPNQLTINVVPGFPGAFSFFDKTGAEWPVERVFLGDVKSFRSDKTKTPAFSISAETWGVTSSGWFELKGLDTIIPFTISSVPEEQYNMRRKIIIPYIGPLAKKPKIAQSLNRDIDYSKAGPEIFAFINGTTNGINGAKETAMSGIDGQAFLYNGFVYIRTKSQLSGAALILLNEASLGQYHLYKVLKRSFYRFYNNSKLVKVFVKYD